MLPMVNGMLLLVEGAQHPCRGPPETGQPSVMSKRRQSGKLETRVPSVVTQEAVAVSWPSTSRTLNISSA